MMTIESWLYRRFGDAIPYRHGTDVRVNCPFCRERVGSVDDSGHLYVSLVKQTCHCFRCDYASSWTHLIMGVDDVSYSDALDEICDLPPISRLKALRGTFVGDTLTSMPDNFITISDAISSDRNNYMAKEAGAYLAHRLKKINDWRRFLDVFGIWQGATGYGKLVMPVERGWYQYRNFHKEVHPRYVSCKNAKVDRLYNHAAIDGRYDEIFIAEGIISAIHLGSSAIALCGKTATEEQTDRLASSHVGRYIICLDFNTISETIKIAEALSRRGKCVSVRVYRNGDPADSDDFDEFDFNWRSRIEMRMRCSYA